MSPLGEGGFGEVWKAIGPGGFHVALKFVRLDRKAAEPELRAIEIKLWSLPSGKPVWRFVGHDAPVMKASFSPDERHILSGSKDRTFRIWNVKTKEVVARHTAKTHCTNWAVFSPDGQYILSCGGVYEDGTTKIDDTAIYLWKWNRSGTQQVQKRPPKMKITINPNSPFHILTSKDWKWSRPVNLGRIVNTKNMEAGSALSADGLTLFFCPTGPAGWANQTSGCVHELGPMARGANRSTWAGMSTRTAWMVDRASRPMA